MADFFVDEKIPIVILILVSKYLGIKYFDKTKYLHLNSYLNFA